MDSTNIAANEQAQALVRRLQMPFPTRKLTLRILQYNQQKTRALVCYALSKASVIDRLNTVCGLTGWTSRFTTQTMNNVSRKVGKDRSDTILSGKILITCQLEIYGLGVQESTGEMWADDDNASTSAEAQSLKRAAARFGIGLYLEGLEKSWLPVDGDRKLSSDAMLPMPDYALLEEEREDYKRRYADFKARLEGRHTSKASDGKYSSPSAKSSPPPSTREPGKTRPPSQSPGKQQTPQELDRAYAPFRSALGEPLLKFVIAQTALSVPDGTPLAERRQRTVDYLSRISSSMKKIREMAENIPESSLFKVMESCQITTMTTIPTVDALRRLQKALTEEYERHHQGRPGVQAA